jgi:hypothetical protein
VRLLEAGPGWYAVLRKRGTIVRVTIKAWTHVDNMAWPEVQDPGDPEDARGITSIDSLIAHMYGDWEYIGAYHPRLSPEPVELSSEPPEFRVIYAIPPMQRSSCVVNYRR